MRMEQRVGRTNRKGGLFQGAVNGPVWPPEGTRERGGLKDQEGCHWWGGGEEEYVLHSEQTQKAAWPSPSLYRRQTQDLGLSGGHNTIISSWQNHVSDLGLAPVSFVLLPRCKQVSVKGSQCQKSFTF